MLVHLFLPQSKISNRSAQSLFDLFFKSSFSSIAVHEICHRNAGRTHLPGPTAPRESHGTAINQTREYINP